MATSQGTLATEYPKPLSTSPIDHIHLLMTDFKKLKVVELRAELAARNLPQTGKRDELIERLEEYEFHHAMPTDNEPISDSFVNQTVEIMEDFQQQPHLSISPVLPPSPIPAPESASSGPTTEEIEEEKRRQRAIRFGLDATPAVKIEVTIKRLEHALPTRHYRNHHGRHRRRHDHHHHNNRKVGINKP